MITDILSRRHNGFRAVLTAILSDVKYWYFGSVAAVFFLYFFLKVDKTIQFNDTKADPSYSHIAHILKQYTFSNFLWINVSLSVALIVCMLAVKKTTFSDDIRQITQILLISDLVLIAFYCICITYRLPRYMDSHISIAYICSGILLMSIGMRGIRTLSFVILGAINFAASFRSFDPASSALFKTLNVGDHFIVDYEMINHPSLGDSIICNREYYSYEALLDKVLTYALNDKKENDDIMLSLGTDAISWGFSGGRYSYSSENDKRYFDVFYDKAIKGLSNGYSYEYFSSETMIPFRMRFIFNTETVTEAIYASSAQTFYYIYMPTLNNGKEQEIYKLFNVEDEINYEYRGWQMNCIKFSRK